jgi:hypothetical protein
MNVKDVMFAFVIGVFVGRISTIFISTNHTEHIKEIKEVVQPKPLPKDTSSYHWTDEYTDAQLREMCKDGTLKLK